MEFKLTELHLFGLHYVVISIKSSVNRMDTRVEVSRDK